MPWNAIINDPCTNVELTDAVEIMQNFQYRLQNVLPLNNAGLETDNSFDLGSPAFRWRNLYLSGGIIMANATRVHAYRNSVQIVGAGAWTTIIFNVEDYDLVGDYDNTTGILTAVTAGYYEIETTIPHTSSLPSDPNIQFGIFKNGTCVASWLSSQFTDVSTLYNVINTQLVEQDSTAKLSARIYLAIGDTLDIRGYSNNGNLNVSNWVGVQTSAFVDIIRRQVF